MEDLTFDDGNQRFIYRVAGVSVRDGRALVSRWEGDPGLWCLPGGRVGFGEGAEEALARELREELGCEASIGRLLWIIDNHFTFRDRANHAIELYYAFELPAGATQGAGDPFTSREDDGSRLFFEWVPVEQLAEHGLKPDCLADMLQAPLPETPAYVLHRDDIATRLP